MILLVVHCVCGLCVDLCVLQSCWSCEYIALKVCISVVLCGVSVWFSVFSVFFVVRSVVLFSV